MSVIPSPGASAALLWPALLWALLAGCTTSVAPSTAAPTATPPTSPSASPAGRIPVLIDTDMAADDIVALAAMLRDPGLDIRSITVAGTGEAHCEPGTRNVQRMLEAFGISDMPVGCGREDPGPDGRVFPAEWRAGADDMYGLSLPAPSSTTNGDAVRLIVDAANDADGKLVIVAIGPWSNLADAVAQDPSVANKIAIHAMGGALEVPGSAGMGETTPADRVEWNLGVDPAADAAILASTIPITLVPLDATNHVPGDPRLLGQLTSDHTAAGAAIVHELMLNNPFMTTSDWYIWDPLAGLTLTTADLVTWRDYRTTFVPTGRQAGRIDPLDDEEAGGRPLKAAVAADADRVYDALIAALQRGEPLP